ncbi:MAG: carbamoyl-phosphate synthase small subunit [Thermoproteota archaeon]|nr:carbamoyl-phosphate synthase small subunit [Thermoproteota archaeon]
MDRVFLTIRLTTRTTSKEAILVLEDGTLVRGAGFGALKKICGEVVFNTGMVGYPESITDPSYKGQILMQTYPLVGNYGVFPDHFESDHPQIEGYIIHELCRQPNHWSSIITLDDWLEESGVPGIEGVDTRMLTKKIRISGTMLGILWTYEKENEPNISKLKDEVKNILDPNKRELAYEVATDKVKRFDIGSEKNIVLIDCGVKSSIIKNIMSRGFNVIQVPPKTSASQIIDMNPLGVVLSNGPGDPKMYSEVIQTTRQIVDEKVPIFGICLGCQILALSLGGDTYKLKFGHRGQNHPCIDLETGRCYITSQNHGYAVDEESTKRIGFNITLINANDKTVEGIVHRSLPLMAVQFHPESSPGPHDTNFLFDQFLNKLNKNGGFPHA